MKRLAVVLSFVLALSIANGYCYGDMSGGMGGAGKRMPRGNRSSVKANIAQGPNAGSDKIRQLLTFEKELGLTETQVERIKLIREEAMKNGRAAGVGVESFRQESEELLDLVNPDFAGARVRIDEMGKLAAGARKVLVDAYEEAYSELDKEQKGKLAAIKAKLKKEKEEQNDGAGPGRGMGSRPPMK